MARSKMIKIIDNFISTAKKGYDSTYWIFVVIASGAIFTKFFGIGGTAATIITFVFFYLFGRISIRREKIIAKEKADSAKN